MIWTLSIVLLALWVVGMAIGYTMGGLIHALLLLALIGILFQLFRGRDLATR